MSFILFLLHLYFLNCLLSLLRYAQLSVYNICISVNEEARNCKGSKGTVSISGFLSALLPADSGDKLNYSLTVLLGFIFAQTIIAGSIPKVSRSPALAEYVMQAIVLCAVNLGACCFLTYLYKKPEEDEPPQCIKVVCIRCVGTLFCRPCCRRGSKKGAVAPHKSQEQPTDILQVAVEGNKKEEVQQVAVEGNNKEEVQQVVVQGDKKEPIVTANETEKSRMKNEDMSEKIEESDHAENWHELANILNIIFSIVYGVASALVLLIFIYNIFS